MTNSVRAEPRVLLISIDGLRPDVALRAEMPNLRALMANGSFTFLATTTPAAITLPSHTSMLTGVTIERHGISGNDDEAVAGQSILVPTIFDLAKAAGVSTGMASGKSKFSIYEKPIDHAWRPEPRHLTTRTAGGGTKQVLDGVVVSDDVTGAHAVELLETYRPRFMFVHFGRNDYIGHAKGWGSAEQVAGLTVTDGQIGRLVLTLGALGVADETTIIVTADHGGAGRVHGHDVVGSAFIPWIIAGPGVRRNVDLSLFRDRPIRTYDTFATACRVLGLTPAADIDGSPVLTAYASSEMLHTDPLPPSTRPATRGTTTRPANAP